MGKVSQEAVTVVEGAVVVGGQPKELPLDTLFIIFSWCEALC